jgi:hypothetical protein
LGTGFGTGQLVDDGAQIVLFGPRQGAEGSGKPGRVVFVLQEAAAQQRFGGCFASSKAGIEALQQERLHESRGSGALLQGGSKIFCGLIRQIERVVGEQSQTHKADTRIAVGGLLGIGMDGYRDLFQQAGVFEGTAAAQDGMTEDRVVFSVILGC